MLSNDFAKRLVRSILWTTLLVIYGIPGWAGGARQREEPARCQDIGTKAGNRLLSKRHDLEERLRRKTAELGPGDHAATGDGEPVTDISREIEDIRLSLAELAFDLDCQRSDWEPTAPLRGNEQLVEITTYYATNRTTTGTLDPANFYGPGLANGLAFGKVAVTVPNAHALGALELPALWKLELTPDPSKHFILQNITPMPAGDALGEIGAAIGKSRRKSLLLFVHGFRVTFEEAALRSAQLALDLRFPGVVMFYSWPSTGTARGYPHDEEAAILSEATFNELIERVAQLPVDDIYILAHSMGNRIVTSALAERARQKQPTEKIRALLLAAPDINAQIFLTKIAPGLRQLDRVSKTIYASSNDVALAASKWVHDFRRVGETSDGVQTYAGFQSVDASTASPRWRSWGHSYVFDSTSVLEDIEDLIVWDRSIEERRLKRTGSDADPYWLLTPSPAGHAPLQ